KRSLLSRRSLSSHDRAYDPQAQTAIGQPRQTQFAHPTAVRCRGTSELQPCTCRLRCPPLSTRLRPYRPLAVLSASSKNVLDPTSRGIGSLAPETWALCL